MLKIAFKLFLDTIKPNENKKCEQANKNMGVTNLLSKMKNFAFVNKDWKP